ncbi:MAG: site-2 protease family protein, partial [Chloroflexota bacterium]
GAFIPMLLVLVVVHELGHFATARAFGVKALEFGVGFPPRAFGLYTGRTRVLVDQHTLFVNLPELASLRPGQVVKVSSAEDREGNLVARTIEVPGPGLPWTRRRSREEPAEGEYLKHEGKVRAVADDSFILADMLYSLNWMPLGGFVRLAGESNPAVPRSLAGKGTGTRFLVLAAGPFMNAVLPLLLFAILFMVPQNVQLGQVIVAEVAADSPAAAAGVKAGDIIVRAGGRKIENQADLVRTINLQLGSDMEWVIDRNGEQRAVRVIPRDNPPPGQGPTGVRIDLVNARVERRSDPPWVAVPRAFTETGQMLVLLKREVSSWIAGERAPQLIGPVGLVQVTGEFTQ